MPADLLPLCCYTEKHSVLAKRIYEAVQDGRVRMEEGWNGVKRGNEVPSELRNISLHQCQQSIKVKKWNCIC